MNSVQTFSLRVCATPSKRMRIGKIPILANFRTVMRWFNLLKIKGIT